MRFILAWLSFMVMGASAQAIKILEISHKPTIQAIVADGCPFVDLDPTLRMRVMPSESRNALNAIRKALKNSKKVTLIYKEVLEVKVWISLKVKISGKTIKDSFYLQVKFVDKTKQDNAAMLALLLAKIEAEKKDLSDLNAAKVASLTQELTTAKTDLVTAQKNTHTDEELKALQDQIDLLKCELAKCAPQTDGGASTSTEATPSTTTTTTSTTTSTSATTTTSTSSTSTDTTPVKDPCGGSVTPGAIDGAIGGAN